MWRFWPNGVVALAGRVQTWQPLTATVQYSRRVEFEATHNIPPSGSLLMVVNRSSPVDPFF